MNTDNQTSDLDPQKIAMHLTQGAQHLDSKTVSALQQAREHALGKQLAHKHAMALSSGHSHHLLPHTTEQWLALSVFVVLILVGSINYWHDSPSKISSSPFDVAHLDIAILTDDLPMNVFID